MFWIFQKSFSQATCLSELEMSQLVITKFRLNVTFSEGLTTFSHIVILFINRLH